MTPYISVIIPTYNRRPRLETCLEHLSKQSLNREAFEVIIVNDGSTDDTKAFLDSLKKELQITSIHQKNTGQGVARNNGLKHAKGEIVLFIGDDIYAEEEFLLEHSKFHQEHPENQYACLGFTDWHREEKISEFMEWLVHGGPQFAYHRLTAMQEANFWYFYTSNISLKKDLLGVNPFNPIFKGYGWEDIELAYRLYKENNLKIIYNPSARAAHDDPMDLKNLRKRMNSVGRGAVTFQKLHPELNVVPTGVKKIIFSLIGSVPSLLILKLFSFLHPKCKRMYWYSLSKRYFLEGLKTI